MTELELKQVLQEWQLTTAQIARILCLHTNKMSEYLDGVSRIPCAVAFHIEALQLLAGEQRQRLFAQRLNRSSH